MNIQRKKFLYFLKVGSSYYTANNGLVTTTATPTPLRKDVLEWREVQLQWKRHSRYHGVFRSFVVPMTFAKDGATILRHIYYTQGVEGACTFLIKKLNPTDQLYYDYYEGAVDFSQAIDNPFTFQAAILDAGLSALVKAKENTTYEIPLLDSDCLKVYMDGITLRGTARWVLPEQGIASPIGVSNTFITASAGAEGINEATLLNTTFQTIPPTIDIDHGAIYTAKFAETVTISINAVIWITWPSAAAAPATLNIGIKRGVQGGTVTDHFLWTAPSSLSPGSSQQYNVANSITLPLAAGESIAVFALMLNSSSAVVSSTLSRMEVRGDNGYIEIYTEYRRPPTAVRWLRQIQVFQKLITAMSDGLYTGVSNYLNSTVDKTNNKPYNTLLTCGDALRGLGNGSLTPVMVGPLSVPGNPAKIKISLDELQQDGISRDMTGIGVEGNTVRYEHLSYFYDNTSVIMDIGEIARLQVSVDGEHIWNTLRIGYNYRENEKLNGKDDPFLTHQYASAGIRVKKEENRVSPFVASIVTHEYVRANLGGKKTTDSNNDNDTFICEVSGSMLSGLHLLRRDQNATGNSISGMLAGATAYNLSLTPKRNFYRNAPLIHTALHLMDDTILKFQTADQNAELVTKLSSSIGTITEKADVLVSSLDAPLFLPIIFEFETPVPTETLSDITANPYGKIRFTYKGIQREMFIQEVSIKPADNATCIWKGLAAPDTDLSTLIH